MIEKRTKEQIIADMVRDFGLPKASKILNVAGSAMTESMINDALDSILFSGPPPVFEFKSHSDTVSALNPATGETYERTEDGKWSHLDRRKSCYVGYGSKLEKWLNEQLEQHVLKMTVE